MLGPLVGFLLDTDQVVVRVLGVRLALDSRMVMLGKCVQNGNDTRERRKRHQDEEGQNLRRKGIAPIESLSP